MFCILFSLFFLIVFEWCVYERCVTQTFWGYDLFWFVFVFVLIFITWSFSISVYFTKTRFRYTSSCFFFILLFISLFCYHTHNSHSHTVHKILRREFFLFRATIHQYIYVCIEFHLLTQYQSVSILTNFVVVDIYFAFIDKFFFCRLSADFAVKCVRNPWFVFRWIVARI